LLDGSWSEAKSLWWRNPWLLKLRRLVLDPQRPSHYNRVRREPRREALSTIEAAALLLNRIEGRPEFEATLTDALDRLIAETRSRAPNQSHKRFAR
jgi:DTW domain-containing protein